VLLHHLNLDQFLRGPQNHQLGPQTTYLAGQYNQLGLFDHRSFQQKLCSVVSREYLILIQKKLGLLL
jgi:hypothetical protein